LSVIIIIIIIIIIAKSTEGRLINLTEKNQEKKKQLSPESGVQLLAKHSYYNNKPQSHFTRLWFGIAFAAWRLNVCQTEIVRWHNANRRSSTQFSKGCADRPHCGLLRSWVSACRRNSDRSPPSIDMTWSSYSFQHRTGCQW